MNKIQPFLKLSKYTCDFTCYSSVTFGLGLVYGALRVRNSPEPCVTRREDVTFREVILRFLARRRVLRLF